MNVKLLLLRERASQLHLQDLRTNETLLLHRPINLEPGNSRRKKEIRVQFSGIGKGERNGNKSSSIGHPNERRLHHARGPVTFLREAHREGQVVAVRRLLVPMVVAEEQHLRAVVVEEAAGDDLIVDRIDQGSL
ncbi:MAG: hypothetical protein M3R08_12355 [Bacteroidota bacterium]|nr:hypothetical protein [Bacteroidota bacterium]